MSTPYKTGSKCSECKGKCTKGLCDCGGKVCYNKGRLNLKTCKCECRIDCNKSVDYKKDSTKKWTCRRLAGKYKNKMKSKCRGGFYSLACPWICDICPYANAVTGSKPPASRKSNSRATTGGNQSKPSASKKAKTRSGGSSAGSNGSKKKNTSRTSGATSGQSKTGATKSKRRPCKLYTMWYRKHSMCARPSKRYLKASGIPTGKDRDLIVNAHNKARSVVQPPAADMQKMYWDQELAEIAKGWVASCSGFKHDKTNQRYIPGKYMVGQNISEPAGFGMVGGV